MSVDFQMCRLPERAKGTLRERPMIIGLYGVPGSGKTYLINKLKNELDEKSFAFYEGSEVVGEVTPGGLDAFKKLDEQAKSY